MSHGAEADPKAGWTKFIITTLLAIIAFIIGLVEYGTTNRYSLRKPFLQMQSDLCKSASEAAARIATSTDKNTWQKALDDFWMLYWGPLAIVEDVDVQRSINTLLPPQVPPPEPGKLQADLPDKIEELRKNQGNSVADSMIVFAADLGKATAPPPAPPPAPAQGEAPPAPPPAPLPSAPKLASPTNLQRSAFAIAQACQKTIKRVWDVGIWGGLWEWVPFKEPLSRVFGSR